MGRWHVSVCVWSCPSKMSGVCPESAEWASNASDEQMTPVCICDSARAKLAVYDEITEWVSNKSYDRWCLSAWVVLRERSEQCCCERSEPRWWVRALRSEAQQSPHSQLVVNKVVLYFFELQWILGASKELNHECFWRSTLLVSCHNCQKWSSTCTRGYIVLVLYRSRST